MSHVRALSRAGLLLTFLAAGRNAAWRPTAAWSTQPAAQFRHPQDNFATAVPGFGGIVRDSAGAYVVWVLDTADAPSLRRTCVELLQRGGVAEPRVRLRQGRFAFTQLKEWWYALSESLPSDGISGSTIDQRRNRIRFDIHDPAAQPRIEAAMDHLRIPREAVLFERREPIRLTEPIRVPP